MTYIEIGGVRYPAVIEGAVCDRGWDNREAKSVTLTATYAEAAALFTDDLAWSIVAENTVDGETVTETYDNSDYSILGDITVHRDGTVTVKLGKPTDLEAAYELLYGGERA